MANQLNSSVCISKRRFRASWFILFSLLAGGCFASAALADAPKIATVVPTEVQRGLAITVNGINFEQQSSTGPWSMKLCPVNVDDCKNGKFPEATAIEVTSSQLKFLIPVATVAGRYRLLFELPGITEAPIVAIDDIHVGTSPVNVSEPIPVAAYPSNELYAIDVRGSGFSESPHEQENKLILDGKRALVQCLAEDQSSPSGCTPGFTVTAIAGGQEVQFSGIPADYAGVHKLQVQVGDGQVSKPVSVTLSEVKAFWPRIAAAIAVTVLLTILLVLLSFGSERKLAGGAKIGLLKALFVDPETSTYSLSKVQFYVWTFASVAGYIYLTAARSLVQGSLELADVPQNLPGVMLTSVGTTVLATGISSLAGGKGSGELNPMPSDLITSGGVVAPERLQFLLWTLIGSISFLIFTFGIDPADIQNLPKIPDGFLAISAVSAAGYIGGKIARGPGPKITNVTGIVATNAAAIALTVDGANIATKGSAFYIAREPASSDPNTQVAPVIDPTQSVIDSSGLATRLMMKIQSTSNLTFQVGQVLTLTIVNPDGEKAVWQFTTASPPPTITSVAGIFQSNAMDLTVTGSNIAANAAKYLLAVRGSAPVPDVEVKPVIDTAQSVIDLSGLATRLLMKVQGPTGITLSAAQELTLTIVNPDGVKAMYEFKST